MKKFILISIFIHLIFLGIYQFKQDKIAINVSTEKIVYKGINLKSFSKMTTTNAVETKSRSFVKNTSKRQFGPITNEQEDFGAANINNTKVLETVTLELIQFVEPKYPAIARQKNLEGRVVLELEIAQIGSIENVQIIKSSGFEILDKAALDSVKLWKFKPRAVLSNIKYNKEIIFQLNN